MRSTYRALRQLGKTSATITLPESEVERWKDALRNTRFFAENSRGEDALFPCEIGLDGLAFRFDTADTVADDHVVVEFA